MKDLKMIPIPDKELRMIPIPMKDLRMIPIPIQLKRYFMMLAEYDALSLVQLTSQTEGIETWLTF